MKIIAVGLTLLMIFAWFNRTDDTGNYPPPSAYWTCIYQNDVSEQCII